MNVIIKDRFILNVQRDRIHERLIDKEKAESSDKEEWVKLSSSVAINLTSEQTGEGHAAPSTGKQRT